MKIYILRHAQAVSRYPDASRELSEQGKLDAAKLGQLLAGNASFTPKQVWQSPYQRALETMEIVLEQAKVGDLPLFERADLTPDQDPRAVLRDLNTQSEDLLIVGHNPHLSILASHLLSGERSRVRIDLQTCTMLCLEWAPLPNVGGLGPYVLSWMLNVNA